MMNALYFFLFLKSNSYLLVTGVRNVVQERHVLVAAGLCVRYPRQAGQLEPHRVSPLAPVHVVPEGQDQLQHLLEPLAPLDLLGGLQHGLELGLYLAEPHLELLLVVQGPQSETRKCLFDLFLVNEGKKSLPLFVMRDA